MSPTREEVFIRRSDSLPSRFTASAPDVALALAANIQESLPNETHGACGFDDGRLQRNTRFASAG